MLAADPTTGEVRRFLTGPVGCEITAVQFTPDMRTMFVNIQHPGEAPLPHPGPQRSEEAEGDQLVARRRRGRAPALGDHRDPAQRRRHRRHLSALERSPKAWPFSGASIPANRILC